MVSLGSTIAPHGPETPPARTMRGSSCARNDIHVVLRFVSASVRHSRSYGLKGKDYKIAGQSRHALPEFLAADGTWPPLTVGRGLRVLENGDMRSRFNRIGAALAPRSLHLERRPLDWVAIGLTLLLCVMWGVQQTAMKLVADDVDPIMQLGMRFAVAAVFYAFLTWRQEGRRAFCDGTLPSGVLLGALFSLGFILVALALKRTSAAHTIVFLYTAPIFTALGLRVLPHERLNKVQWGGISLAIAGIATAFIESSDRSWASLIGGDALALLAGAAWGMSNVALRMGKVSSAGIAKTVFYQVGMGGAILIGFAYLSATTHVHWTPSSIAVQAYQTVCIALISYLIWFWLLGHYLTSRLMLLSLLTPLFGVAAGAWWLHEVITLPFIVGAIAVLTGIIIVNRFG